MGNTLYVLSAGLEFFFAAVSVILMVGCFLDHDRKRTTNRLLIAILIVHAFMNTIDACIWLWSDIPKLLTLMKLLFFLSYTLGCIIFMLFSFILIAYISEYTPIPPWLKKGVIIFGLFLILLWVISLFNGMYYYWDSHGVCLQGDFFWVSQVLDMVFLVANILLVLIYRKALKRKDIIVLLIYNLIPLTAFGFGFIWEVTPIYMASTISLLLYYTVIHLDHGWRAAKQELELVNIHTAVMLSQIRPHFLYNALTSIAQLCSSDPGKAKESIIAFSEYLRGNMKSLETKETIPFTSELEHVKAYLAIEQVRFADYLNISYDIRATDFEIPPLCLQSIVENAVKHGVSTKASGGSVRILTREYNDCFEITVSDDGVGFDTECISNDGRMHFGIKNTRERLEKIINGKLYIKSEIGLGTEATIQIPKRRTEKGGLKNENISC